MSQIDVQTILDLFKESIGVEASEKIIHEDIKNANLSLKSFYTFEEFCRICDELKKRGGFIKKIAVIASTTAYNNLYYQKELAKEKREKEDLARLSKILEEKIEERTKQLKETQAQMLQSAKMAAVGQLSAGVAHEINNPLSGILGYAQFILSKLESPDISLEEFKACREFVKHIEREAQRCKKIVGNLLTFSRSSNQAYEPQDIKSILETTLSLLRSSLKLNNIEVTTEYAPQLPSVIGDANQLQQVFTNIIINSQQAMNDGGHLNICVKVVKEGKKENTEISFQDTGFGIHEENIERIFDPFFTTKEEQKSIGLGLSICYQIIQQHNGQIFISSEVGKGTTFKVLLPCNSSSS